jgi:hypothetical protein
MAIILLTQQEGFSQVICQVNGGHYLDKATKRFIAIAPVGLRPLVAVGSVGIYARKSFGKKDPL